MEDFIIFLLQFVIEFVFDVLIYFPFDWPSRTRTTPENKGIFIICSVWWLGANALAGLSLTFYPNSLIALPSLRIANLILAPIISALLSQALARTRAKVNANIRPRNHFWQAFWFTLGFVMVRFAYAVRH
jgi:hypothetical protein